ncbi:MAG: nucleotidyl transferase AbiEii/AbiGii toxin family protein [Fibromonadales bacterium]|nr:nucleotidyl transferase AbiEii/AbiGii toxin family protein [Fibromonadales bacterium]
MNNSMQLKALIRNLSAEKNVDAGIILRNFMHERLLERISISEYKNKFVFKGGMLISAIVGIDSRSTMDIDANIKGQTLNETEIVSIVNNILSLPVDDNVSFTLKSIDEIRDDADYPGYRIAIEAILDKTCQMLKMDVTTGDPIVPKETEYNFMLMFQDRAIGIMAYNLETILAEKVETVIARSVANTRMRDFYDIYILTLTQKLDYGNFKAALKNTVEKRGTVKQMDVADEVILAIAENAIMIDLWQRYRKKYSYAANVTWEVVIESLKRLLNPN